MKEHEKDAKEFQKSSTYFVQHLQQKLLENDPMEDGIGKGLQNLITKKSYSPFPTVNFSKFF